MNSTPYFESALAEQEEFHTILRIHTHTGLPNPQQECMLPRMDDITLYFPPPPEETAPTGRLRRSQTYSRADIISAFTDTFQLIGGVSRFALWADSNPTDFYKLHARLLPASSTTELDGPQDLIIQHAIPT